MRKKLTTEEFINKATLIHGDRYDYSKSDYIRALDKIQIICKKHGSFWQVASSHTRGNGCKKCILDFSVEKFSLSLDNKQSYLLGLLQSDGHRNSKFNNSISIEISNRDRDILEKIKILFSLPNKISTRVRDTNFIKNYTSCSLAIHSSSIANIINFIPCGVKSEIVMPPDVNYFEHDYWRGFIDGDGSLGLRKSYAKLSPFISIATNSEHIARSFEQYVFRHSYSKNKSNRNKRDNSFNITIGGSYCKSIVEKLYYPNCLSLDRKMKKANAILKATYSDNYNNFSREEDAFILNHLSDKEIILPNRIKQKVKLRIEYLLSKGIDTPDKLLDIKYFI